MFKYFTAKNTLHYLSVLPRLVSTYNNCKNRSLGMAPSELNPKNEKLVWGRQYKQYLEGCNKRFRFRINDVVRITKVKGQFQHGYQRGWTREKFKIVDRCNTIPPKYKVSDLKGEILEGTFYEQELGKVSAMP